MLTLPVSSSLKDICLTNILEDLDTYIENYNLSTLQKRLTKSKKIIIVHQMGKVGSSTVCESLKRNKIGFPVVHTHFLEPKKLQLRLNSISSNENKIDRHLITSLLVLDAIRDSSKKIKIVTLVREPIARNISAFFESINRYIYNFNHRYKKGNIDTEDLVKSFLKKFPHQFPLNWFDKEMKAVFGIDVYKRNFDFDKGYQIYGHENSQNLELLLIKLEKLNDCHEFAFSDFFGLDNFILEHKRLGSDQKYADLYNQFKNSIKLSEGYAENLYNSKYVRHFYSREEIDSFKDKWLTK